MSYTCSTYPTLSQPTHRQCCIKHHNIITTQMSQQDNAAAANTMRLSSKTLIDYFSRSLTFFQASEDGFRVLCTLPHQRETPCARKPRGAPSRVVVLDSSFNPPTRAHAQMAQSAILEAMSSSSSSATATATNVTEDCKTRLVLLLAVNNADKAPKPASFPQRLGMMDALGHALRRRLMKERELDVEVDLAVTTMPYFNKKAAAIEESGFYEVDETVPEQEFLAGFDTVIRVFNPKYYTEVVEEGVSPMKSALEPFFDSARLRVTMRPDDEWGSEEEQEAYVRGLEEGKLDEVGGEAAWAKRIELVKGDDGVGVSSSKVRAMVEAGETRLEELVGEDVKEWIEEEGLYRTAE